MMLHCFTSLFFIASSTLTSSEHQQVDLAAHWQIFQDVHYLRVAEGLHILPVDFLYNVPFQQTSTPLGIQNHFHLLSQRTIRNSEAKSARALHQRYADQLGLQQGGLPRLRVAAVGHRWVSSISVHVMKVLGGGGAIRIHGQTVHPWHDGYHVPGALFAGVGVLWQRVSATQHHVNILIHGNGLEHLHHICVGLAKHACVIYVHDDVT